MGQQAQWAKTAQRGACRQPHQAFVLACMFECPSDVAKAKVTLALQALAAKHGRVLVHDNAAHVNCMARRSVLSTYLVLDSANGTGFGDGEGAAHPRHADWIDVRPRVLSSACRRRR